MTDDQRQRVQLPAWFGTLLTVLALVGSIAGTYADSRVEIAALQTKVAAQEAIATDLRRELAALRDARTGAELSRVNATAALSERVARVESTQKALLETMQKVEKTVSRIDRRVR